MVSTSNKITLRPHFLEKNHLIVKGFINFEQKFTLTNPEPYCLNCEKPFQEGDKFCAECGQKKSRQPLHLKDVLFQTFITVFNLDNTFLRSVFLLRTPWKLTQNFVAGKRTPYYHPARMFLVLLFILFSLISVFYTSFSDITIGSDFYLTKNDYIKKDSLDSIFTKMNLSNKEKDQHYRAIFGKDKIPYDTIRFDPFMALDAEAVSKKPILLKEVLFESHNSLLNKYEINGFLNRLFVKRSMKLYVQNDDFISFFLKNVLWALPICLVFTALVLLLFYFRRSFYYMEHLTLLLHIHSSAIIIFILLLLLERALPNLLDDWVWKYIGLSILGLSLFSFKNYYKQNWMKTIIKFTITFLIYFVNLAISTFIILLFSVVIF